MMPRVLLLGALLAHASPAAAQTPRDLVTRAVEAMGGVERLRAVRTIVTEFYGSTFGVGQEETPAGQARASALVGRISTDHRTTRRTGSIEIRGPGGVVNRLRRVTAGGIGMLETNGRPAPDNPATVAAEETAFRRAPERLLLTALDNPGALTTLPAKTFRGDAMPGVRYASGPDTLDLYFDPRSGLLTVTETLADDPIVGDRRTTSWLTRWEDVARGGGVKYFRQYDVEWNGRLQTHSVFTAVAINAELPDSLFLIPDSIAARAQRANPTPPPVTVRLVELAPGVWRAEGGSHHSLVVEQPTRLVVVEAPLNARRSAAVLDTLRVRFPSKPVGLVVNTHHHYDHSGGVRGYLAAGIPVVTHARNAAFIRGLARAGKTVEPDALSRRRQAASPAVQTLEDSLVLGAGDSRVVIYRLPTAHVEGMVAAYVPAARLVFTSDVLSPAATLAPAGSQEIVRFVRARALTVERVAGGHGGVANWVDVEAAATRN
jgi:glyoxylase-like metal-dependent hydrolase (beta-lactamase superfamily II)